MSMTSHPVTRRALLGAAALAPLAGSLAVAPTASAAAYPSFDLKVDFGAVGDGTADDTAAFQRAAWAISATAERGATLNIPAGTYRVGRQLPASQLDAWINAQSAYISPADLRADLLENFGAAGYQDAWRVALPIFHIGSRVGLEFLQIRGNGATIRLTDGLLYGSFDPATGAPRTAISTAPQDGVETGRMIQVIGGSNLTISSLILNGRSVALKLGGLFGDTGRQLKATGIRLLRCRNVTINSVISKFHGLDGFALGFGGLTVDDPPTQYTLSNLVSEYNGRQGLSWTGGRGLTATGCKFRFTGRAVNNGGGVDQGLPLSSKPGAGVDIEPESSVCFDGQFTDCEFYDNAGPGVVTASQLSPVSNIGDMTFDNCRIWGGTTWAIYTNAPRFHYDNCDFYGSVVPATGTTLAADASTFTDCTFVDLRPATETSGDVYRGDYLINGNALIKLTSCTITAYELGSIYSADSKARTLLDCTINHNFRDTTSTRTTLCALRGWRVDGTQFWENITRTGAWQILAIGVTVASTNRATTVEGSKVLWNGSLSGTIPNS